MRIYQELDRNPTRRTLLEFGLIFFAGTGLIGAVNRFYLDNPNAALGFWIAGTVVFLLSQIPQAGRLLYMGWMMLGLTIGFVTTPIIMSVLYLVAIVPFGIVLRLLRRDTMRRKLEPAARS